jgi:hypothetical protein
MTGNRSPAAATEDKSKNPGMDKTRNPPREDDAPTSPPPGDSTPDGEAIAELGDEVGGPA